MQKNAETIVFIVFPAFSALLKNNGKTLKSASFFPIIFAAKITQKSTRKRYEFRYPFRTHIFPDFYRILAPNWTPKPTQDPRKKWKKAKIIDRRSHRKIDEKNERPSKLRRRGVSPYKLSRSGRWAEPHCLGNIPRCACYATARGGYICP